MNDAMIATAEALTALADRLGHEPLIACDLEADSLHHYWQKVCLLQFSVPGYTALVDPLAVSDLTPLAPILADPAIRKIFHGADYDIRCLHRDFGISVVNLFDSMIACQLLGEAEFGLAAVLHKRFGVEMDKRHQKSDWSRRPLSPAMLAYAAEDTGRLLELYRQLVQELRAKGRLAWAEEECAALQSVRMASREEGPLFLRFKGAARLPPRTLAVLEELLRFRDAQAQQADLPPFRILYPETVASLAERRPRHPAELARVPGLSGEARQRLGSGILAAVERGLAVPEGQLPRYPSVPRPARDRRKDERFQRLKDWRREKAAALALDPGVLANSALLEALAALPAGAEPGTAIPRRWQRELFGAEVAALLA